MFVGGADVYFKWPGELDIESIAPLVDDNRDHICKIIGSLRVQRSNNADTCIHECGRRFQY